MVRVFCGTLCVAALFIIGRATPEVAPRGMARPCELDFDPGFDVVDYVDSLVEFYTPDTAGIGAATKYEIVTNGDFSELAALEIETTRKHHGKYVEAQIPDDLLPRVRKLKSVIWVSKPSAWMDVSIPDRSDTSCTGAIAVHIDRSHFRDSYTPFFVVADEWAASFLSEGAIPALVTCVSLDSLGEAYIDRLYPSSYMGIVFFADPIHVKDTANGCFPCTRIVIHGIHVECGEVSYIMHGSWQDSTLENPEYPFWQKCDRPWKYPPDLKIELQERGKPR